MADEKEEYKPTGSFGNMSINYWRKYVKDGKLDGAGAMKAEGLNERQIPRLEAELEAAGLFKVLPKPDDVKTVLTTQPLHPPTPKPAPNNEA